MNDAIRMQLSAYVDGELPSNEAEMLLRRVCQDAELRQEIAEYLAMRRLLRGEPGLAAADRLYQRVAAEIDHRPIDISGSEPDVGRAVRPLAGFAIAASVALLAIFALQQTDTGGNVNPEVSEDSTRIADTVTEHVPDVGPATDQHREFFLNHANASGMNLESVVLRFSEELVDEADFDDARDASEIDDLENSPDGDPETDHAAEEIVDPAARP